MATRFKPRRSWGDTFAEFVMGVAVFVVGLWALTLLFGVLHHGIAPAVPALGWKDLGLPMVLASTVVRALTFGGYVKVLD